MPHSICFTVRKRVCYSIKLKLEFVILSRLIKFLGEADHFVDSTSTDGSRKRKDAKDIADFIDVIRAVIDARHAFWPSKTSSSRPGVDKIDIECA